ncbi:zinc finger MYM-type 1-like [Paramuricea clavata]|uniref:Zinc finger MYM-type 1-like n=1 Tax=Paramuricea clavata TaxID=317549 RepID=A0A7D9LEK5_PARCT|nr:zinc finger MYM-type 1-like [Paramuricea clavata]
MKLRGRDDPALLELLKKRGGDKYTSHDIQNEIIEIMAHEVQRDLIKDIGTGFFSIIADEYTDIGNKEQLTLCFRWVDEQLDGHEDFLGFYNIPNIASETIVQAIKDSLIRLQLSLSQCRGQCYDGASNMLGKKSGVAKQIQECEAKALPTHCHGHSLSLGVKDATNNCQILSNTMNNTNEIVKLVKYSPKRENLLGELKENLQYKDEEEEDAAAAAGLTKFSATRWTVRAICFERVIDNYNVILKLWDECLKTKLPPDIRGRIIGCSTQMESFDFYFGLHLGVTIFRHTDNLSATLQKANMSSISGQHNTKLTTEVLKGIRNEECFKSFFQTILKKKEALKDISEPEVPRKRKAPARYEVGEGEPWYPKTSEDLYRKICYEALDLIVSAINERFDQPSFKAYAKLEALLLKSLKSEDISYEMAFVKEVYHQDIKVEFLIPQLEIFKVLMKEKKLEYFAEVLDAVKNLDHNTQQMINEVLTICKLLLVNPATSATGERSFSTARRIKTWLRANMSQRRISHLAILNTHKIRSDNIRLLDVANVFVSKNDNRKRNFGSFTEQDLCYILNNNL